MPLGRTNYCSHFPSNEQRRQLAEEKRSDFVGIIESASQPPSAEPSSLAGIIHHESTISRKLDKLAKSLRKQIVAALTKNGMSRRQAEEALEVDVRDLQVDIRRSLAQETPPSTFSEKRVEARVPEGEG